jgi:hypothetical protein
MRYYLDTEFDGHGGPLISLALVREDRHSLTFAVRDYADDPWVQEHVIPQLWKANASTRLCTPEEGAASVAHFLRGDPAPVIIADWLADISHLCRLLTVRSLYWSDPAGDLDAMPPLRFEVANVDAYPTTLPDAVQHNAWWDAMALREKLSADAREANADTGHIRADSGTNPE